MTECELEEQVLLMDIFCFFIILKISIIRWMLQILYDATFDKEELEMAFIFIYEVINNPP